MYIKTQSCGRCELLLSGMMTDCLESYTGRANMEDWSFRGDLRINGGEIVSVMG